MIMLDDKLYLCRPARNVACRKTNCYVNGGPCMCTSEKSYGDDGIRLSIKEDWIPCEERLPELHKEDCLFSNNYKCSDPVLVSLANEYEGTKLAIAYYSLIDCEDMYSGWVDNYSGDDLEVIAWQPLPKPYIAEV